jgi:hypothetical protein
MSPITQKSRSGDGGWESRSGSASGARWKSMVLGRPLRTASRKAGTKREFSLHGQVSWRRIEAFGAVRNWFGLSRAGGPGRSGHR